LIGNDGWVNKIPIRLNVVKPRPLKIAWAIIGRNFHQAVEENSPVRNRLALFIDNLDFDGGFQRMASRGENIYNRVPLPMLDVGVETHADY
jgi:hypothetical protein